MSSRNSIDWRALEDRRVLHAVESLLIQALRHLLNTEALTLSYDAATWQADSIDFRRQARPSFLPSMRQKLDLPGLYADALAAVPTTIGGQRPLPLPDMCPVTPQELLGED